jgi:hypothetical protein
MSEENNKVVDGVDLSKLTADQLISLTGEEWNEVKTVFEAAVKAKAAEEWAEFMANIKTYMAKIEACIGRPSLYVVAAYLLLDKLGVI